MVKPEPAAAPAPDPARPPLTRIVATLGPASAAPAMIERLIEAGVSVFRLNFSHGDLSEHQARLDAVRAAADRLSRPVAVLGDLPGPKIRIGRCAHPIEVETGSTVIVQRAPIIAEGTASPFRLSSTYPPIVDDARPGERVLINDGAVRMLVVDRCADEIRCTVTQGGTISSGKGINLPESTISAPAVSDRDLECAAWAVARRIDFVAMSFVAAADDVRSLRSALNRAAERAAGGGGEPAPPPIVAKIERPVAVRDIDAIVEAADAVMVARGDLGVEMDLARVPVVQKRILAAAQAWGKPGIVATQMLESMIEHPQPTRAEASDIANAIFDGADALMLSGETAVGRHPLLAVEIMRRIAAETEAYLAAQPQGESPPRRLVESRYRTAALAHGVWTIAQDIAARFIVVWSQRGGGARYLSQNNFTVPIISVSTDDGALRRMQLLRGVIPVHMPLPQGLDHFRAMVDEYLLATGWAAPGDRYICVAGEPLGEPGVTNGLSIHTVGRPRELAEAGAWTARTPFT
jgi:pyruvate kinase